MIVRCCVSLPVFPGGKKVKAGAKPCFNNGICLLALEFFPAGLKRGLMLEVIVGFLIAVGCGIINVVKKIRVGSVTLPCDISVMFGLGGGRFNTGQNGCS